MSTPIKGSQDPLMYAPPWARERAHTGGKDAQVENAPRAVESVEGSEIKWPPAPLRGKPFEGDVAIVELRRRLSLKPDLVPEPPFQIQQGLLTRSWLAKISLYIGLAAIIAYGIVEFTHSSGRPRILSVENPVAAKQPRLIAATASAQAMQAPQLVIEEHRAFINEPLELGAQLSGVTDEEFIVLSGLPLGTRLSAGRPVGSDRWQISVRELGGVRVYAPDGFVGVMDAKLELRSAENSRLGTRVAKLEWIPKPFELGKASKARAEQGDTQVEAAAAMIASDNLSRLIKRGLDFLKEGDVAASRLVLRRAADAGNAQAALMLGATFDPVVLAELGVFGLVGNPELARAWYQKAMEFGSTDASRRIERLARVDR